MLLIWSDDTVITVSQIIDCGNEHIFYIEFYSAINKLVLTFFSYKNNFYFQMSCITSTLLTVFVV